MTAQSKKTSATHAGASFSGHETFVFRYAWMKKAVDAVREDAGVFASDQAMVRLGVGKNMVRSMRHWAIGACILEEVPRTRGNALQTTTMGNFLFGPDGRDPYLEDANSLYLLHWSLATNEHKSTTWSWTFNLYPAGEFTRDGLAVFLQIEAQKRSLRISSDHVLRRDVDCFIRTYTQGKGGHGEVLEDSLDCPLVELGLITEDRGASVFQFRRGAQPMLSAEVFTYCLLEYWDRVAPQRDALAFSEAAYGFGSPGCVFKFDENSLADRLEALEAVTHGRLAYTETAGLKQIYRREMPSTFELLERHYELSAALVPGA